MHHFIESWKRRGKSSTIQLNDLANFVATSFQTATDTHAKAFLESIIASGSELSCSVSLSFDCAGVKFDFALLLLLLLLLNVCSVNREMRIFRFC